MEGKIDTNAVTGDVEAPTFSDAEISGLLEQETEVLIIVVKNDTKTRPGGAFFPNLSNTICDLDKYGLFKTVDIINYNHNCLYLVLQAGGLSDIKLQELVLTLRNRTIRKCDLSNVCNIELISIRTDGKKSDVEHYTNSLHIAYNDKYNMGLLKLHYFINDTTALASYCLDNYEEVTYIKGCNNTYWTTNDTYKKSNDIFITAYQLFNILMNNVDKLIAPMDLTYELLNTQFYDKIEEYKTF